MSGRGGGRGRGVGGGGVGGGRGGVSGGGRCQPVTPAGRTSGDVPLLFGSVTNFPALRSSSAARPVVSWASAAAGPSRPLVGSASAASGPSCPLVGSASPATGPSRPLVGSASPAAGPSRPLVGSASPAAGPSGPLVRSASPAASPSGPLVGSAASASGSVQPVVQLQKKVEEMFIAPRGPPSSSKAITLPLRPGIGKAGKVALVKANHFLVKVEARNTIHHYSVAISPEVKLKKVNREIMKKLQENYKATHLGDHMLAYDGRQSAYTAGALPFVSQEFVVTLTDDRGERNFKVVLTKAALADVTHLQAFINGKTRTVHQEVIQALDVVLRQTPSTDPRLVIVGNSFFDGAQRGRLGNGVEFWRGYYQSLRPTQNGISLNIDVSTTAFYENMTVDEFVASFLNVRDLGRGLSEQDRIKVKKVLRKVRVEVTHTLPDRSGNRRRYGITDITTLPLSQLSQWVENDVLDFVLPVLAVVRGSPTMEPTQASSNISMTCLMWSVSYMAQKMVNGGKVDFWWCVNFSRNARAGEIWRPLVEMCRQKGMAFHPEPAFPVEDRSNAPVEKILKDLPRLCHENAVDLELLIIILPDISGKYGTIKRICETELGIISQCLNPRKASRSNNQQYFENVALKINAKVGGRNSVLQQPIPRAVPLLTNHPAIIIGADVTHPQPGEDSAPSIASVVASMDWPEVTKYRSLVSAQPHRQEIIQDLMGMIRDHLIAFFKATNGHKPKRIIFYRDGVSEGQFNAVLKDEVDAIRRACISVEQGYLPPVTFVVVQKRHHTRLFPANPTDHRSTDKSGNILPGTVVDTDICHPTQFDFYLCSHAGIKGTSRPTHYHVLYDENKFDADSLQRLTYNLCYTYARCTRAVSIVPPAYYAHLAAYRARYYVEGLFSDNGSQTAGRAATREQEVQPPPLPTIKGRVKDRMFFC